MDYGDGLPESSFSPQLAKCWSTSSRGNRFDRNIGQGGSFALGIRFRVQWVIALNVLSQVSQFGQGTGAAAWSFDIPHRTRANAQRSANQTHVATGQGFLFLGWWGFECLHEPFC